MTTLYVTVWDDAAEVALGQPIQEFKVAIGPTSTQSEVVAGTSNRHRRMRLFAVSNCFVTWGVDPLAKNDGSSGRPLGAENPEYFAIDEGQKLAVIERI